MKKKLFALLISLTACALVFAGWHFGRQSGAKLATQILKINMYDNAYGQLSDNQTVIEELDSNRIEDAKHMLYLGEWGDVFALDNMLESTNSDMSPASLEILLKMDEDTRNQYGSAREASNKLFALIAKYRAEHPWNYTGKIPHTTDAELEAKVDSILKRASQSEK